MARELGITQANASYHLRLLRTAGLLEEAGEEKVDGGTAKRYRALWDRQQPRDPAHADADAEAEIRAMVEVGASRLGQRRWGTPGHYTDAALWVEPEVWEQRPRAADRGLPADARVGPPAACRGNHPREPLRLRVPAGGRSMTWGEAVGVLRERRFAWYFAARTVSTAGTAMAPVALAFAVLHLTDSAGALAQVLTARTAAMVLFLLVGGVVSDRMSRTTVLQLAHALTAITQGAAAALVISGHADLWMLTGIEAVNGAASAFTFPAMAGIVPLIVDRARLQPANALLSF